MKKFVAAVAASTAALALAAPAFAGPPGHPDGPAFGVTTATIATSNPSCIVYHVQTGLLDGPCAAT